MCPVQRSSMRWPRSGAERGRGQTCPSRFPAWHSVSTRVDILPRGVWPTIHKESVGPRPAKIVSNEFKWKTPGQRGLLGRINRYAPISPAHWSVPLPRHQGRPHRPNTTMFLYLRLPSIRFVCCQSSRETRLARLEVTSVTAGIVESDPAAIRLVHPGVQRLTGGTLLQIQRSLSSASWLLARLPAWRSAITICAAASSRGARHAPVISNKMAQRHRGHRLLLFAIADTGHVFR